MEEILRYIREQMNHDELTAVMKATILGWTRLHPNWTLAWLSLSKTDQAESLRIIESLREMIKNDKV